MRDRELPGTYAVAVAGTTGAETVGGEIDVEEKCLSQTEDSGDREVVDKQDGAEERK